MLAASLGAEAAKRSASKGAAAETSKATSKSTGKTARAAPKSGPKSAGKKVAKGKSKDDKAASRATVVPQIPLAPGPPLETSEVDVASVRSAIDALRHGDASQATAIAAGITEPAGRKLVEWLLLRGDHKADSARYVAFIKANPAWPSLDTFRRRAEARLWVENAKPAQVLSFFNGSPPQSGMGRLVLARALSAQGDKDGAGALVRQAWRSDSISADVEKQVLERYSEMLTRADHKARMDKRLFALDHEAALRAARPLGAAHVAIAQARIALNRKAGNAKKLIEAVPADARQDPAYLFAQAYLLRHDNKFAEATKVLLSAPRELAQVHDGEEWWVERRIMARKLLDLGDARSAYLVVAEAAEPTKENSRVERHFMAGWIALRFLDDPATAATHFVRIPDASRHPTSLARSHYWLGRAAEASNKPDQARAEYQAAARASLSYYGQLARARLGVPALALAPAPPKPDKRAEAERLELV
ncbi:MAG: lytic transglycosylase domain-containing protein, partial [Hyphomicrobiales bacterium]|nr:lytic transglycosylase domain-containing protein [Hyphomicrobiales bacterium]